MEYSNQYNLRNITQNGWEIVEYYRQKIEQKDGLYLVNDTEIALSLEKVDKEIIKTVIDVKPQKVITIDRLFNNNDQLKTNTALQMRDAGIEFKVV